MKKKMVIIAASGILFFLFFLNACTKQNEETLMQESGIQPCDSSNMSYATDIQPIMEFNCVSCHNSSISNLGVILTDYNDILIQVNNGNLINVIEHNPGYPQMPFGLPQLPTCTINKILAWVNRGAPNN